MTSDSKTRSQEDPLTRWETVAKQIESDLRVVLRDLSAAAATQQGTTEQLLSVAEGSGGRPSSAIKGGIDINV